MRCFYYSCTVVILLAVDFSTRALAIVPTVTCSLTLGTKQGSIFVGCFWMVLIRAAIYEATFLLIPNRSNIDAWVEAFSITTDRRVSLASLSDTLCNPVIMSVNPWSLLVLLINLLFKCLTPKVNRFSDLTFNLPVKDNHLCLFP